MKKYLVLLFLTCSFHSFAGKYKPVYNPEFAVDGNLSMAKLGKAIKEGVLAKGWTPVKVENGVIHAKIIVRAHTAEVKITYTTKKVKIEYEDSSNLGYREKGGEPLIHNNYNRWVTYLEQAISRSILQAT